jgi:hypothetical protein
MTRLSVGDSITQTANRARALLLDPEGKPKGIDHYLASLTLHLLIRPAKWFGGTDKPDVQVFEWGGTPYVYDPGVAAILLDDPDEYADRLLCNAAAVILRATRTIADDRLWDYACRRLSGDIPAPAVKRKRGDRWRTTDDNRWRDTCIAGCLIPPLLRAGFPATRNDATETASACSIVSQTLATIGIQLDEKTIARIWARWASPPDI